MTPTAAMGTSHTRMETIVLDSPWRKPVMTCANW
jgi:hypothetical protein